DPDAATIRFPTRYAGAEVLVRVSDSFVIFLFELVFVGVGIGIAPAPKLFDKTLALVVSGQFLECLPFFVGDDVSDVLVEPVFVSLLEFGLYIARLGARILLILRKDAWADSEKQARYQGQTKGKFLVRHSKTPVMLCESCDTDCCRLLIEDPGF